MLPKTVQLILFSATFPDLVRNFAVKFAPTANEIKLKQEELSVDGIKQFYMDCKDEQAKYDVLVELYSLLTIGQSIIFCKVRSSLSSISIPLFEEKSEDLTSFFRPFPSLPFPSRLVLSASRHRRPHRSSNAR